MYRALACGYLKGEASMTAIDQHLLRIGKRSSHLLVVPVRVKEPVKILLWSFVFTTAFIDILFFWYFRSLMKEVEVNPVAIYFFSFGGVPAVVALRMGILLYAFGMSRTQTRISGLVLPVWAVGHAILFFLLIGSFLEAADSGW